MEQSLGTRKTLVSPSSELIHEEQRRKTEWVSTGAELASLILWGLAAAFVLCVILFILVIALLSGMNHGFC